MFETMSCGCRYSSPDGAPPWRLVSVCAEHAIGRMIRITTKGG